MWHLPSVAPKVTDGQPCFDTKVIVRVIRANGVEQFCGFFVGAKAIEEHTGRPRKTKNKNLDNPIIDPDNFAFDDCDLPGMRVLAWRALDADDRRLLSQWLAEDDAMRAQNRLGYHEPTIMRGAYRFATERVLASGWRKIDPRSSVQNDFDTSDDPAQSYLFIDRAGQDHITPPPRPWLVRPRDPSASPAPRKIKTP